MIHRLIVHHRGAAISGRHLENWFRGWKLGEFRALVGSWECPRNLRMDAVSDKVYQIQLEMDAWRFYFFWSE